MIAIMAAMNTFFLNLYRKYFFAKVSSEKLRPVKVKSVFDANSLKVLDIDPRLEITQVSSNRDCWNGDQTNFVKNVKECEIKTKEDKDYAIMLLWTFSSPQSEGRLGKQYHRVIKYHRKKNNN